MDTSNVKVLPRRGIITLDAESAPILLELVTKAAVTGAQAHILADLYAQARKAAQDIADSEA